MTTRNDDVAAVRRGPRYAIYTCTPTALDLAHMVPLVRRHRAGCEEYFNANAPPGAQLAGTAYDDEADQEGTRPAFERLVNHVEEGRIHVVLLITVHRFVDSPKTLDGMIARLSRAGANVVDISLVDVGSMEELLGVSSPTREDVS